jgi:serine/threonine protein kinase
VIISDLNFAKILPGPSDRAYTICGPVGLMAPEVMHNVGYGFPSDWWMYGILFHEVLVGEPPNLQYSSSTRVDVAAADNTEHGHEASSALDGISKGGCIGHSAWDLLQRLLDPNPRTRLTGDRVTHNGGASNATAVRNKGGAGNKSGVRRRAGEVDKNDAMEVNNNTIHKHRWFQFYQHTRLVWASFEELEHTPPLFSAQEHKPPHTHVPRSLPGNRRHHANKSSDKQQQQPTNRGGGVDGKEPRFGVKCSSGGDGGRGGNSVPGGSVAVVVMPNARLYGALPVFGDTDLSANRLAIRHDHDILRHAPRCRHHLDFPNNATIATAMRSFTSRTTAQPQI